MSDESDPTELYRVVCNHEEQYSIWPADRDLPAGWRDEGTAGSKEECLAHIDEVWVDMRPLSLREFMARAATEPVTEVEEPADDAEPLVKRLSQGEHPVEVSIRPERTGAALRQALEAGYVFIRFTDTRGGTELGVRIDGASSDWSGADFDAPAGRIRLVGDLTLDFEPVRCMADIDVATMAGTGRLSVREPSA